MLDQTENEDQLGIVLAHEITHAILGHGVRDLINYTYLLINYNMLQMEQTSWSQVVDSFMLLVIALIWALIPTAAAFLAHVVSFYIAQVYTFLSLH